MEWLKEFNIIHNGMGLFHTITAVLSILFGTIVLLNKKGTSFHKKIGYCYLACMIVLNLTSFAIVNFEGFSLFHFFSIVSLTSISLGIYPAFKRKENWLTQHFYFMNWSVIGLYCAFWAELGVRLFDMRHFWWAVMLATILTSFIGFIIINREAKKLNL